MRLLLCCLILFGITLGYIQGQAPPNVVLFYADDLGWGDLSVNNSDPAFFRYTPNIDRLFTEGVRIDQYLTHCVCSPSRAGLLTGQHYAEVAAGPLTGGTLPIKAANMARDFQAAGYTTGIFGKWHNGMPNFPEDGNGARFNYNRDKVFSELHDGYTCDLSNGIFDNHKGWEWSTGVNAYGFDRWVGYYGGGGDLFDRYSQWHHDINWWHDRRYVPEEKGYTTDLITRYAVEFIESSQGKPFFCYVPQEAVHHPIQVKLSDLKALCEQFPGEWDYVKNIVSPSTGRKIEEVEELRCFTGEEFDVFKIDPEKSHFHPLIFATYLYSLDQSIAQVMAAVDKAGQTDNTIFLFLSDNGAHPNGSNYPFRGGKHSLWEGGVHVPAAIWWPGKLDKNTPAYHKGNAFTGLVGYYDIYPTLMAATGQTCQGKKLDGQNVWQHLQQNTNPRDKQDDAIYEMWRDHGSIRTSEWKLILSGSKKRRELYHLTEDISEETDVATEYPEVVERLEKNYRQWLDKHGYAVSYFPVEPIAKKMPKRRGEVIEVVAEQTRPLKNSQRDGVFIRFASGKWGEAEGLYFEAGDRMAFDLYICEDSELDQGMGYTVGMGWTPFFTPENGLNQDGNVPQQIQYPKGEWIHQEIGVGNLCPGKGAINYLALQSKQPGRYHFYLDNVRVLKKDGSVRMTIWQSQKDFTPFVVSHGRKRQPLKKAIAAKNFPFSSLTIQSTSFESRK